MPPLTVLLASVLKPVDEPRMRGKFAATLLERPGVQVHVAGQGPRTGRGPGADGAVGADERLQSHAIFQGSRLGLDRLRAQGRYWHLLRRVRPGVVIVHAPELLPLTLLWQRLGPGRRFIYDVQENFALNVRTQRVYRPWVGRVLAGALRCVETLAARRAAGLALAEASYADELPFLRHVPAGRVAVLENKYQPAPGEALPRAARPLPGPHEPLRLLFSGTLSELNGVREAVALAGALHAARPGGAHLTVVGFCQQPALLHELTALAAAHPGWLALVGGARPVPHAAVVAAIGRAHLGLLAYRPHPSSERCQPTKLFEYLAHGLPLLVPPNPLWAAAVRAHGAGLVVDFAAPAAAATAVLGALAAGPAFYPQGPPADALWAGEAKKLWALLHLS
ncbi:MAG: hypothetical protein ACRYFR_12580 [Janthinobacterium lividum]